MLKFQGGDRTAYRAYLKAHLETFYNDCHDPSTGEFCPTAGGKPFPDESFVRPPGRTTEEYDHASGKFLTAIGEDGRDVLRDYLSIGSKNFNVGAKGISGGTPKALNDIINQAPPLKHPIRAYRGILFHGDAGLANRQKALDTYQEALTSGKPVTIGQPKGFQSTSLSTQYPLGLTGSSRSPGFMFEVLAKKGAPMGNLGVPGEEELLIGSKERFKVVAILPKAKYKNGNQTVERITVQVEQIND